METDEQFYIEKFLLRSPQHGKVKEHGMRNCMGTMKTPVLLNTQSCVSFVGDNLSKKYAFFVGCLTLPEKSVNIN